MMMMMMMAMMQKVRKKSRFLAVKEVEKALVEGIWKLVHLIIIIIVIMIIIILIIIISIIIILVIIILIITILIMVFNEQEANRNYEEYLAAIGTGPCSQDMVMRADVKLNIEQVH